MGSVMEVPGGHGGGGGGSGVGRPRGDGRHGHGVGRNVDAVGGGIGHVTCDGRRRGCDARVFGSAKKPTTADLFSVGRRRTAEKKRRRAGRRGEGWKRVRCVVKGRVESGWAQAFKGCDESS